MHSVRQKLRPKHQVLVLKCYPRFQKNNVESKPNSSELSYLLYYASMRRSKLQKVSDFLDKKAVSDVYKNRIGNIQVSLQILKALIEKCPRDLPLFRGAILRTLNTVLRSGDVDMVEASVPTFEAICAHQDTTTLAADQDYIIQYEEIVKMYAGFASKETTIAGKAPTSWPIAIRYRQAGLEAIKAVASSDALGSETSRQLTVIIPAILLNIYTHDGKDLEALEEREQEKEALEREGNVKGKQSFSTVNTGGTDEADPVAASGTTAEADKLAEMEVGILALQALRHVFTVVNRTQLRLATSAVLLFVASRSNVHERLTHHETRPSQLSTWPKTLFAMICGWAPVQDRFAILVSAVESLVKSPIVEEDLEKQLILAGVIDSLLSSQISFVGLSVMDVLIGFIQHILLLLQLGGEGTSLQPHHQQADVINTVRDSQDASTTKSPAQSGSVVMEVVEEPSFTRQLLLTTLQTSIGTLATHVYYADQISDMITTILSRLKPSNLDNNAAITDGSPGSQSKASTFFSFDNARLIALAAIREILIVANSKVGGRGAGRGFVGVEVWNGTQWLLRDPNLLVRQAYIEALLTWLDLETDKNSRRIFTQRGRGLPQQRDGNERGSSLVRRAVSNASHRDRSPRPTRASKFLPLLHLAIFENSHQFIDSEADILMLHLLLTSLVQNLGMNAVRYGLPMIMRLQEDIKNTLDMKSKVHLGSLTHGYFWALSAHFEFVHSQAGDSIQKEIGRRSQAGLWGNGIRVPPTSIESIRSNSRTANGLTTYAASGDLHSYEDRELLVDTIAQGYNGSLQSPAVSPPSSPSRSFSSPMLSAPIGRQTNNELPADIREQLLADWTKEATIAATTKDTDSSASVSGSKTGTGSAKKNLLAVNIPGANMSDLEVSSPTKQSNRRRSGTGATSNRRKENTANAQTSADSNHSGVRVQDLKHALSGSRHIPLTIRRKRNTEDDDDTSDSMVSADFSPSEVSFVTAGGPSEFDFEFTDNNTPKSDPSPSQNGNGSHGYEDDEVPPVPPLPPSLLTSTNIVSPKIRGPAGDHELAPALGLDRNGGTTSDDGAADRSHSIKQGSVRRTTSYRGSAATGSNKPDFSGLLNDIDVEEEQRSEARVAPPY